MDKQSFRMLISRYYHKPKQLNISGGDGFPEWLREILNTPMDDLSPEQLEYVFEASFIESAYALPRVLDIIESSSLIENDTLASYVLGGITYWPQEAKKHNVSSYIMSVVCDSLARLLFTFTATPVPGVKITLETLPHLVVQGFRRDHILDRLLEAEMALEVTGPDSVFSRLFLSRPFSIEHACHILDFAHNVKLEKVLDKKWLLHGLVYSFSASRTLANDQNRLHLCWDMAGDYMVNTLPKKYIDSLNANLF